MLSEGQRKVAFVTGASSGIGRGAAEAFVARGYATVLVDRDEDAGREVEAQLRRSGECVFIRCDVADDQAVGEAVEQAVSRYGRLDAAFNAAGVSGGSGATADYAVEHWTQVLAVDLTGVWLCMRHQIPQMLKTGGGSIVNCASAAGLVGFPYMPAYVAAKHGVVGLTKAAALEYARDGIRVNAVCPGYVDTPMTDQSIARVSEKTGRSADQSRDAIAAMNASGRLVTAEEVAASILHLCRPDSRSITGACLTVDGGTSA